MLLQINRQASHTDVSSVQECNSEMTPSLAVLDDAQALTRKEWKRVNLVKMYPDNTPPWLDI